MAYDNEERPVLCSTCGTEIEQRARFCLNCGAATSSQGRGGPAYAPRVPAQGGVGYGEQPNIPNYLVQAILVTICCCLPAGIVAIVYAAQVNGKIQAGDYAGATSCSANAKTWCWVSLGVGIVVGVIYSIIIVSTGAFAGL